MKTFLCPLDFTPCADNALRYANELARRLQANLILFHSVFLPKLPELLPFGGIPVSQTRSTQTYLAEQKARLEGLIADLRRRSPLHSVSYQSQVHLGIAAERIPQLASETRADLIIMGSHGASGLKEVLTGSLTANVLEQSPCPVLVIPEEVSFQPVRRMLLATDLSEAPPSTLTTIVKMVRQFDAELTFLHVVPDETPGEIPLALQKMNRLYRNLAYEKKTFYCQSAKSIEEGIKLFMQTQPMDWLVMLHHPRRSWQFLFYPSHTRKMAHHTHIPILAFPDQTGE